MDGDLIQARSSHLFTGFRATRGGVQGLLSAQGSHLVGSGSSTECQGSKASQPCARQDATCCPTAPAPLLSSRCLEISWDPGSVLCPPLRGSITAQKTNYPTFKMDPLASLGSLNCGSLSGHTTGRLASPSPLSSPPVPEWTLGTEAAPAAPAESAWSGDFPGPGCVPSEDRNCSLPPLPGLTPPRGPSPPPAQPLTSLPLLPSHLSCLGTFLPCDLSAKVMSFQPQSFVLQVLSLTCRTLHWALGGLQLSSSRDLV